MVEVIIGISTYGDYLMIDRLIKSIRIHTTNIPYNIIIIDDGSQERIKYAVREVGRNHQVTVLEHKENTGISSVWNHLSTARPSEDSVIKVNSFDPEIAKKIEEAFKKDTDKSRVEESQYIVILNNDVVVTPEWLDSMFYFFENNKDVGVVGLHQIHGLPGEENKVQSDIFGNADVSTKPAIVLNPPGQCFMFRRSVYKEVGPFDENNFRCMYEDVDFGTRCLEMGYKNYCLSYPRIYHEWSKTFSAFPELEGEIQLNTSRERYKRKWGGDIPQMVERLIFPLPTEEVVWLSKEGPKKGMPNRASSNEI